MAKQKSSKLFLGILIGLVLGGVVSLPFSDLIKKNLKTQLISWQPNIVDFHESIQSAGEKEKLLATMEKIGISKTVLMGAPKETIFFKPGITGFTGYDENNAEILEVKKANPGNFLVFCAINPEDKDKLTKVQECEKNGASGIKLYSGHSLYYNDAYPLDEESMKYVYKYLEEKGLPLMFSVNLHNYKDQFEKVLNEFPKLKVVCAHFCNYTKRLSELDQMLQQYPNLYIDLAFGYSEYVKEKFGIISEDVAKFRDFFSKYQDRILFGTSVVVTSYEGKEEDWLVKSFQAYKNLLEKDKFSYFLSEDPTTVYNGLSLSPDILKKIYSENYLQLFATAK